MRKSSFWIAICLLVSFLFGCSSPPKVYPKADRALLIYKAEITQAEADLESGRYCYKIYDYERAELFFLKSFRTCQKIGFEDGMLYSLNDLGLLDIERGYFSSAKSNLIQALALARKTAIPQAESDVLNNMALLDIVSGNANFESDTGVLLSSAMQLCKFPIKRLVIQINGALHDLSKGDFTKAESALKTVRKQSFKKEYYELMVRSTLRLGQLYIQKGDPAKGLRYASEAYDLAVYWDDRRGIIDVSDLLSLYFEKNGDRPQSLAYAKIIYNVRKGLAAKAFEEPDLARVRRLESP